MRSFVTQVNCFPCVTFSTAGIVAVHEVCTAVAADSCENFQKRQDNRSLLSLHSLRLINSEHWIHSRAI